MAFMAQTFANQAVIDPRDLRRARKRFFRDDIPELAFANSFYLPSGILPARGWLLLSRASLNAINKYATNLTLTITDFANGPLPLINLAIVQARCVSTGLASDPDAVYLVEVTDARGLLWNRWFQFPTTEQYNIIAPAYSATSQVFYTQSTNSGVPWTWVTMVEDLWNQMGAFLGTFPGLPNAGPADTPEGWAFPGVSAWEALNKILDYMGMVIAGNVLSNSGIVVYGAPDAAFAAQQVLYAGALEDDLEYIDLGSGRVPAEVVVLFHRRNQYYGTEETVRYDAYQWTQNAIYGVTVSAPALFASAVGSHYIWADFTVRFDVNGNPLAADVVTAATVAANITTAYYNRIYRGTLGYMHQWYAGALPFVPGSQVDGVAWRQDYAYRQRQGWVTEIVRGWPLPKSWRQRLMYDWPEQANAY